MNSKLLKIGGSVAFFLIIFIVVGFNSCNSVPVGSVGVKVNKLGGSKGVDTEVLGVGRYWIGWNEELHLFPTYQVNYSFTRDVTEGSSSNEEFTFQTREGMECGVDLGIAMHYDREKIVKMFQTYRKGEEEIRAVVVRNTIRDALNKIAGSMPVESVYGAGKGLLIDSVQRVVQSTLAPTGIIIDKISLIGSVRIPASVKDALDSKVKMTQEAQRAENEVAKAVAEANIRTAKAKGEADALKIKADAEAYYNQKVSQSLTPQIVEMKRIDTWDGHYPQYYGVNGGLLIK
ncbi:MAG TPA: SPFH domain-containing protein [Paludibacter sp.]|nr:SPFH domain-containing protein [Paludibacter sp.]